MVRVFLGGASAVGKSAFRKKQNIMTASAIDFESAYILSDGDKTKATELMMSVRGDDNMLYEHTNICPLLYKEVHEYMNKVGVLDVNHNWFRTKLLTKNMITKFYSGCLSKVKQYAIENSTYDHMIVMMDLTSSYQQRYFQRMEKTYNQIDYPDIAYLYFQQMAYIALLQEIDKFPNMHYVIIFDSDEKVFGEPDIFDLKNAIMNIPQKDRVFIKQTNDIFSQFKFLEKLLSSIS